MQPTELMSALLIELETTLINIGWWQQNRPSENALASKEPFCIDTLTFTEWLQWVCIPKTHLYIKHYQQLPGKSGLRPIAEEAWRGCPEDTTRLLNIIDAMDALMNQTPDAAALVRKICNLNTANTDK